MCIRDSYYAFGRELIDHNAIFDFDSTKPVSYTHLDVYKRQQVYSAREVGLPGGGDEPVNVYRLEEDVFSPAALASMEGKDVTRGHPPDMLDATNQARCG